MLKIINKRCPYHQGLIVWLIDGRVIFNADIDDLVDTVLHAGPEKPVLDGMELLLCHSRQKAGHFPHHAWVVDERALVSVGTIPRRDRYDARKGTIGLGILNETGPLQLSKRETPKLLLGMRESTVAVETIGEILASYPCYLYNEVIKANRPSLTLHSSKFFFRVSFLPIYDPCFNWQSRKCSTVSVKTPC